jgi:hypothetical protein
MPTKEQLYKQWNLELAYPELRHEDNPLYRKPQPVKELTGKLIGSMVIDAETGDFKIIPNNDEDSPIKHTTQL